MKTILIFFNQVRTCFGGNNQKRGKLLQSILIERLMILVSNFHKIFLLVREVHSTTIVFLVLMVCGWPKTNPKNPQFWSNISRTNKNFELHVITMHNYAKFYLNGTNVSEGKYSSMHKSPILRKAPREIFLSFFITYTQPKITCILKI